ncbi:hypothetical protein PVK06_001115 [Gossypium arboreum]|uniref:(+)-delta-cadinene synthase n=1 Tax=Gossypium arboreum TaxID=29729 RepID=A0ABR0R143_GOSAR|nr:hypothetical protein PVK06_001115 [Gossypium arboreum]
MGSTADPFENVKFIDTLLRLGVSYHFEDDIQNQLETIFTSHHNLLAKITMNVFNKFKDTDGKFKETLIDDVRGMLSLYETAYLRVHGEDILEEALAFTKIHLKSLENKSNPHLAKQIANALDQPLNKCPPRLAARTYIFFYEEEDFRIETLLKFAKLDFNRVQVLHKQKISQIARFWEDRMGKMAAIEAFKWLRKEPKSMKALDVISHFMNDIVSHKFEQLRHHCPSSVECYMIQHGLSKKLTLKDFEKILEDAWKDLNKECMRPTDGPRDLLLRILNYARAA